MALEAVFNFFTRRQRYIGSIPVDIVSQESYRHQATVTKNPTEQGSNVSDHVIVEPLKISIVGSVTKTAQNIVESFLVGLSEKDIEAYQQFESLLNARLVITLVMGYNTYPNMVMTAFDVNRSNEIGDRLQFTAEFEQIIVAQTFTVPLNETNISPEYVDAASSNRELGRRSTEEG